MKTQVIQLEQHDDIISACDKMDWSKTRRIVLVWPLDGYILDSKLEIKLLLRKSREISAQLAFISSDPQVQILAREMGIPLFSTIKKAQRESWLKYEDKSSQRQYERLLKDKKKEKTFSIKEKKVVWKLPFFLNLLIFLLGISAVLSLVVLFLPGAKLVLVPAVENQTLQLDVRANPEVAEPNYSGSIPAYERLVFIENAAFGDAEGQKEIPEGYAAGSIILTSLTNEELLIPKGTVVTTLGENPVRFQTTSDLLLENGVQDSGSVGIQALQPGENGNVAAGEIIAITGDLGVLATVVNPEALEGGYSKMIFIVSEEDISRLETSLVKDSESLVRAEFLSNLLNDEILLEDSIQFVEILNETVYPEIGEITDRFSLSIKASYSAWVINEKDLRKLIELSLDAALPAGYEANNASISYLPVKEYEMAENGVVWQVLAQREISKRINDQSLAEQLTGEKTEDLVKITDDFGDGFELQSYSVSPSWWPWMPFLSWRINIEVQK